MHIQIGTILTKGSKRVRVIGKRGATTVMVVPHPYPISSRTPEARGIRTTTLVRDWSVVTATDERAEMRDEGRR